MSCEALISTIDAFWHGRMQSKPMFPATNLKYIDPIYLVLKYKDNILK